MNGNSNISNFKKYIVPFSSALFLNSIPLIGVIFFGWKIFPVVFLFWFENVSIGILNVFKILLCQTKNVFEKIGNIFASVFFTFHYGMFTFVHGVFVVVLFGGLLNSKGNKDPFSTAYILIEKYQLYYPMLAVFGAYFVSFISEYIIKKEYENAKVKELMSKPYGRIVVLHLAILFGGFLILSLGSPIYALILLILLKTGYDIKPYIKQKNKKSKNGYQKTF